MLYTLYSNNSREYFLSMCITNSPSTISNNIGLSSFPHTCAYPAFFYSIISFAVALLSNIYMQHVSLCVYPKLK